MLKTEAPPLGFADFMSEHQPRRRGPACSVCALAERGELDAAYTDGGARVVDLVDWLREERGHPEMNAYRLQHHFRNHL